MFGYVLPFKDELKIREYEIFKGYYCGLCRCLGEKSIASRFILNYDMTFLSLLLSSLYSEKIETKRVICPFKMRKVMVIPENPYINYARDMNIILTQRKLIDNYNDEGNLISLSASKILNVKNLSPEAVSKIEAIDSYLNEISNLEKTNTGSLDELGHLFGKLTEEIFLVGEEKDREILRFLGYNIGKWIYTIDAYDDLLDDLKKDRYNPCVYTFSYNGENHEEFKKSIKENIKFTLIKCLEEISKAFELLTIKKNKGILENIIYLGLMKKTETVLEGGCGNEKSIRGIRCKTRSIIG